MAKDICVFVECKDGTIRKASLELLSKAKELTEKSSSNVYAVAVGFEMKEIAEDLRSFADKVIVVDNQDLKDYRWDTYRGVLEYIIKKYNPFMVFGVATITGKDLFPRLAARLNTAIIADAIGIEYEGEEIRVRKPFFGGRILSWMTFRKGIAPIITFRPNSFAIEKRQVGGEIVEEAVEIMKDQRLTTLKLNKGSNHKVDLQEADFIICGGRGMKGSEHFRILEEIAHIMNGRVGASRAVVDSKWREYDDQVGKSGKTVAPKVYIGCGVSGALHHTMGMDTSKTIVAINKDPNAPIFQYADYGIVDDLFTILPALKEELKKTKEEN